MEGGRLAVTGSRSGPPGHNASTSPRTSPSVERNVRFRGRVGDEHGDRGVHARLVHRTGQTFPQARHGLGREDAAPAVGPAGVDIRLLAVALTLCHEPMELIGKGFAMELVMSALLTFIGRPHEVHCFCVTDRKGKPNTTRLSECPTSWFNPRPVAPARIVCEVSANRGINMETLGRQLKGTLDHCVEERDEGDVDVTYGPTDS